MRCGTTTITPFAEKLALCQAGESQGMMHRAGQSQALPAVLAGIKHGSHICAFYETDDDLIDLVILFLSSRADRDELCLWMMPDSVCDAKKVRAGATPAERGIEPYRARDLCLEGPHFEYGPVTKFLNEKLHEAVSCCPPECVFQVTLSGFSHAIGRPFSTTKPI